ncbi:hypothetical protein Acor_78810 [Acrocarpospora corrugata]|uniref:Uncharacterized protein n=1 Tax=Acrocarpospora corrugata TaxID=35763 RepID=A0A5M3WCM7_9ACTN|nr:hypothetical protein [Acrocarpospora corrugata]GES05812.1 hypothetical protein Acor_78810 [Acrocarpospora corrugata]
MTSLNLDKLRKEWIATQIRDLPGSPLLPRIRLDLGEEDLVRALLVAKIAMLDTTGYQLSYISTHLTESDLFADHYPEQYELEALIKAVRQQTQFSGRFSLLNGSLLPLVPDDVYLLLLEHWAAGRSRTLTPPQLQRELTHLWGVKDARVLEAMSSLSAEPLADYLRFLDRVDTEPDVRIRKSCERACE